MAYTRKDFVEYICEVCGTVCKRKKSDLKKYLNLCKPCSTRNRIKKNQETWKLRGYSYTIKADRSGNKNPVWRGGHRHWQAGKLGRDKNNLSWKKQRLIAWERDNYTCQECGVSRQEKGLTWKPDVHHINPYRLSFSHHLDNLKCLCRSCHKKTESKITELWDGRLFGRPAKLPKIVCSRCGIFRKPLLNGICHTCLFLERKEKAKELREQNKSYAEIGLVLGISREAVWFMLNGQYPKKKHSQNTSIL